ncbi:MAG: transposase [Chloroflexi bacterium]|nr:transposase [Chloroflexota bacterium]
MPNFGGIADHVHIALSIPAKIAVATFIGQIKGVTSARFNQEHPRFTPLYWQDGYGAFSVDGKRLPHIIAYIEGQKQHHAQNDIIPVLERVPMNRFRQSFMNLLPLMWWTTKNGGKKW